MVYPNTHLDRAKYLFWRAATPIHPSIRDVLTTLGIFRYSGRQPFLLGHVAPHTTLKEFIRHLIKRGYGNHFVAWHDSDELVSLRIADGFRRQYHLRVFGDGAVHGHYEYTPEAHPFLHLNQIGFEDRRDFFLAQCGELIVPATETEVAAATARYYARWRPPSRAGKAALAERLPTAQSS
ncbi:MAG: hypothetical protein B7X04_01230 [Parcubacteria group bacterium 21-54-25]|nr:MAG: hypothetical protein B7X04_01230 [Parcubacteria group bacterium 21-54-25]